MLSKTKLAAIAAVHDGWIPVSRALPEVGEQVIVTTAPKRGIVSPHLLRT